MALIYIIEDDDSIREIEEFALLNAKIEILNSAYSSVGGVYFFTRRVYSFIL